MTNKTNNKFGKATERLVVYVDKETLGILNQTSLILRRSRSKLVGEALYASLPIFQGMGRASFALSQWPEKAAGLSLDIVEEEFDQFLEWKHSQERSE